MIENEFLIRDQKIHVKTQGSNSLPIVVLLHGFTGTSSTWTEISALFKDKYKVVAVDLTGHGKTTIPSDPSRYSMAEQVADLETLFTEMNLAHFTLVGYSMGGRIALAYTHRYPDRVTSLILESASPGLKTEVERNDRKKADALLASRIKRDGISAFVKFWEEIPLFASQKKMSTAKQAEIRKERLGQNTAGLANSLLGIGTGSQPSYWEELPSIQVPVLLITGEIDRKFVFIAREMNEILPMANHMTIKDIGHAIHVEKPTLFATMVEEHINKVIKMRG